MTISTYIVILFLLLWFIYNCIQNKKLNNRQFDILTYRTEQIKEKDKELCAINNQLIKILEKKGQVTKELSNLVETEKAAKIALLKEKEEKDKIDSYRLIPSDIELEDIKVLKEMRKSLRKPRILSMLIWQTYWQPLAKVQFPIILQDKTKIGIYKITNIKTQECYVGQSVDIYKRWCEHCKAGLGIDTPPGNKLYKAIQSEGLENFTFELLSQCKQNELNERERYFIKLFQADTYGYNSNVGIKK